MAKKTTIKTKKSETIETIEAIKDASLDAAVTKDSTLVEAAAEVEDPVTTGAVDVTEAKAETIEAVDVAVATNGVEDSVTTEAVNEVKDASLDAAVDEIEDSPEGEAVVEDTPEGVTVVEEDQNPKVEAVATEETEGEVVDNNLEIKVGLAYLDKVNKALPDYVSKYAVMIKTAMGARRLVVTGKEKAIRTAYNINLKNFGIKSLVKIIK